ncbi:MAG: hypothetical protein PHC68_00630 [Syntrophorhabdaceae bacterium]|nr:hypothetical protein [Syntrophorhabdaceae bacterium]
MYKLTRPDGFDFYSGTINYRDAIGSVIRVTDFDPPELGPCRRGLHASKNPNDCFIGAKIPCAAFKVKGIQKIAGDKEKSRYQALKVIEEIYDLDTLFGWRYSEAMSPVNPFKIIPPHINEEHISLLRQWASVRASVRDSVGDYARDYVRASVWASIGDYVRDYVRDSVWDSVGDYVWDSVGDYVWDSVRDSVGDSVGDYVWASVRDSVWAYMGSLFPKIKIWEYAPKSISYPFQSAVDLWLQGLVPSFNGEIWQLHGGEKGEILWEGKL